MEQNPAEICHKRQVLETDVVTPDEPVTAPRAYPDDPPLCDWVVLAQQGDKDALESIIRHFQDRVWRRALYRIRDHDEAHEVAQEVFILCFRKIQQYRGEAKFWTWLARIVDSQVSNRRDWWKRRKQDRTCSIHDMTAGRGEDAVEYDPPDHGPSPRRVAENAESMQALDGALAQMSEEHREILLLRFSDGLAYEEIAETLEISIGTVKSRINRARAQLRETMKEHLAS